MTIQVAVLASNAQGERELLRMDIDCSTKQIEDGVHLLIAAAQCADKGYTPISQFDENDPAWQEMRQPAYERSIPDGAIALVICEISKIRVSPSQEEETQGLWTWVGPNGHACECDCESEEAAALDAVATVFPLQDWQYQIDNGDTRQGYFEWALSEAEVHRDEDRDTEGAAPRDSQQKG